MVALKKSDRSLAESAVDSDTVFDAKKMAARMMQRFPKTMARLAE